VHERLLQQQQRGPGAVQLPVSVPADSHAASTRGVAAVDVDLPADTAASAVATAGVEEREGSYTPPAYGAGGAVHSTPPSAHSYVGSTVTAAAAEGGPPAPQWDDIVNTASSNKSSKGWFGVFGGRSSRQQRSALV
jgi:hypothetical protein